MAGARAVSRSAPCLRCGEFPLQEFALFEQRGAIDWASLPPGAEQTVHGVKTRSYNTPTGTVVVWAAHGVVLTCIGDAPPDQLMVAVHGVVDRPVAGGRAPGLCQGR